MQGTITGLYNPATLVIGSLASLVDGLLRSLPEGRFTVCGFNNAPDKLESQETLVGLQTAKHIHIYEGPSSGPWYYKNQPNIYPETILMEEYPANPGEPFFFQMRNGRLYNTGLLSTTTFLPNRRESWRGFGEMVQDAVDGFLFVAEGEAPDMAGLGFAMHLDQAARTIDFATTSELQYIYGETVAVFAPARQSSNQFLE